MKKWPLASLRLLVTSVCDAADWTQPVTVTSAFTETDDMIVCSTSDPTVYAPDGAAGAFIFSTASTDAQRARVWAALVTALATSRHNRQGCIRHSAPIAGSGDAPEESTSC